MLQVRADVFLLESCDGREAALHADVRSTSGILQLIVEIRLDPTLLAIADWLQTFYGCIRSRVECAQRDRIILCDNLFCTVNNSIARCKLNSICKCTNLCIMRNVR